MALYFFKPVVWNTHRYKCPSGSKFTSGAPAEHGFGHEEWNNSSRLQFSENGQQLRIFHTEGFGRQPLSKYPGRIFVFMIASHEGKQYLVGVAGQATSLFDDKEKRSQIAAKLRLESLGEDVWKLQFTKNKYKTKSKFLKFWQNEYNWIPTWSCPANSYLMLEKPLLLDPQRLTGKNRLIVMYGSYQEINRALALRILSLISDFQKSDVLSNLKALCSVGSEDISDDLARIQHDGARETTKKALIDARLGQGQFRDHLIQLWDGRCAVTGCSITEFLRASHVKPWRMAKTRERLDPQNGLLLGAHLDALFDVGLISFDDSGTMQVSEKICEKDQKELNLEGRLRKTPSEKLKEYLKYHRSHMAQFRTQ